MFDQNSDNGLLGIYDDAYDKAYDNDTIYETGINNINADTEQGSSFLNYRNEYAKAKGNNHDLLAMTSSPNLGSIIEAIDGTDSLSSYKSAADTRLTTNQAAFNALLSTYSTAYNSYFSSPYITNAKKTPPSVSESDSSNNTVIIAQLVALNQRLIESAQNIVGEMNTMSQTTNTNLNQRITSNQDRLRTVIDQLKNQYEQLNEKKYDNDSIEGVIETTELDMNSDYIHYIVYFFIGITLIVSIFYISLNPNADIKKVIILLVALLLVYIISRRGQ